MKTLAVRGLLTLTACWLIATVAHPLMAGPAVSPARPFTASGVGLRPGATVFRADFETPAERDTWSTVPQARWVNQGAEHGMALCVHLPPAQRSPAGMVRRPMDLAAYRE